MQTAVEIPLWLVVTSGIFTFIFGGGGVVTVIVALVKLRTETQKTKAHINQIVVSGSIEVQSKLIDQVKELVEVGKELVEENDRLRQERNDCLEKLNDI